MTHQAEAWPSQPDPASKPARPSTPPDFGARNSYKPTKAIIGIAIMLALGFVLHEIRHAHDPVSPAHPTQPLVSPSH